MIICTQLRTPIHRNIYNHESMRALLLAERGQRERQVQREREGSGRGRNVRPVDFTSGARERHPSRWRRRDTARQLAFSGRARTRPGRDGCATTGHGDIAYTERAPSSQRVGPGRGGEDTTRTRRRPGRERHATTRRGSATCVERAASSRRGRKCARSRPARERCARTGHGDTACPERAPSSRRNGPGRGDQHTTRARPTPGRE